MNYFKKTSVLVLSSVLIFLCGCSSVPKQNVRIPVDIESSGAIRDENGSIILSCKLLDKGFMTAEQLSAWFISERPLCNKNQIKRLAKYYIIEANAEGINSDVAFAQMCLETGYLEFGNLVVPKMHNYCGLGAMDKDHPGEWFKTEQIGVRAHIQHLQAYATTSEVALNQSLVDPRYSWVHKTKFAEDIYGLAGVWATDTLYAEKINAILIKMASFLE